MNWLPVFLAAYLFFTPYLSICTLLHYTLFLAFFVAILIDLTPNFSNARPLSMSQPMGRAQKRE